MDVPDDLIFHCEHLPLYWCQLIYCFNLKPFFLSLNYARPSTKYSISSVGEMLDELEWPSLEARRDQSSLLLFHKIHSGVKP